MTKLEIETIPVENIISQHISNCGCLEDKYSGFVVFLDPKDGKIKASAYELENINEPA